MFESEFGLVIVVLPLSGVMHGDPVPERGKLFFLFSYQVSRGHAMFAWFCMLSCMMAAAARFRPSACLQS
jgi:hypothetical protein